MSLHFVPDLETHGTHIFYTPVPGQGRLTPWYSLKSTELVHESRHEPSGRIVAKKKIFSGPFTDWENTQF
jgi:hypothetical protein